MSLPSPSEHSRLSLRCERYLRFANAKISKQKIDSLVLMIWGERDRAAREFQYEHKYRKMSRWDHLKAVFK